MRQFFGILLAVVTGCGPGNDKPPEAPKKASAEDRILSVGTTWQEATQSEGYLNDAEVAFLRATDRFALHLKSGSRTAVVDLEREELIRTPQGREYHCNVTGAVQAIVKFAWRVDQPVMTVKVPASTHRRTCKEPGYPHASRQFEPRNAVYALRGDRLEAIEPPTFRSFLLPSD